MEYPKGIDDKFMTALLIAGRGESGADAPVYNVQTWEPFGTLHCSTFSDGEQSVLRAHAVSEQWSQESIYTRSRILYRFLKRVVRHYEPIIGLNQLLSGKSWLDASSEYFYMITQVRGIKRNLKYLGKPRRGAGAVPRSTYRIWCRPVGVVGMFTSADNPISMVCDILNPIMAGNAVVNFVTPQATLGALLMKAVLVDAGMPADVWRIVVSESSQFGMKFIPALDYVTAIGPNRMCQRISMECARHSVPISCFGAVKKIALVMEDAKLWDAAKACARSAFLSAGQSTNSIEVIFVHEAVREPFEQMMVQYTQEQIRVGRYTNPHATMGSMMYPDRVKNCEKVLKLARDNGARVLMGSHPRPEISPTFFEPTIVADLPPDLNLLETEVYGPVVALLPFKDITNVVRLVTGSRVIDSAAVFTRDIDFVRNLIDNAEFATVCVNDTYFSMDMSWKAPIQGKGESGQGIRHGMEAILQYTQVFSAARLKGISWVPKDWRSGNWTERLTFAFMGFYSWMSHNVTDTVVADGIRAMFRWMRDRFVGPV
ncbi:aldehyde dehydrogenase family protein [uncultured Mobiluncus sp.]|uniref:aldehyde dehydrogenase family protein n=1 Tax=uncultured Mobiluncus sp. TaxID=293425 RepID=UPI002804A382|nr:aldehyde dehydrogenase family protein [uncultured Mobiluncus sp.]